MDNQRINSAQSELEWAHGRGMYDLEVPVVEVIVEPLMWTDDQGRGVWTIKGLR